MCFTFLVTLSTVIFLAIFLPNLQLNIGKKYLKTAKIINESLIHLAYSTSKCLSKTGIRSFDLCVCLFCVWLDHKLSLFILFLFLVFGWIINCPCLSCFCFCVKLFCVLFMCYNQYKLNNSSDPI